MTPTEFMKLGDREIIKAVEEAWKPEISIKEIMKKIVPRSINNGYSLIGKGLCISVFYIENDEENNTIDLIYLEEKVRLFLNIKTGKVKGIFRFIGGDVVWILKK